MEALLLDYIGITARQRLCQDTDPAEHDYVHVRFSTQHVRRHRLVTWTEVHQLNQRTNVEEPHLLHA